MNKLNCLLCKIILLGLFSCNSEECYTLIDQSIERTSAPPIDTEISIAIPSSPDYSIKFQFTTSTSAAGLFAQQFSIVSDSSDIVFLEETLIDTIFDSTDENGSLITYNSLGPYIPHPDSIVNLKFIRDLSFPRIMDSPTISNDDEEFFRSYLILSYRNLSYVPPPIGRYYLVYEHWTDLENKYIHFLNKSSMEKGYIKLSAAQDGSLVIHEIGNCN